MFEFILEIDRVLYEFINGRLNNAFLDWLMPIVTNAYTWIPLYIGLVIFLVYKYRKNFFIPLIGLLLTFAASDYISASVVKPMVNRTRPCIEETVSSRVVGVECRNSFSFPSSHATNHFGIAFYLLFIYGFRKRIVLTFWIPWAVLVSYSRIYVGVHYPFDILGGAILGFLIAWLISKPINSFLLDFKNK